MPSEGEVEPALTFDLLGREFDLPGEENKQGIRMVLGAVKGLSPAFGHLPELCSLLRAVAMPVPCPCCARAVPVPCPGMFPPSSQNQNPHGKHSQQQCSGHREEAQTTAG